ncbi:MAG: F0F1 ATP synthase subunit A [Bdellovibrionales bacterium]|nr:F0F1 ATP synthase subunit A [Bdellovibrionales bacterium]
MAILLVSVLLFCLLVVRLQLSRIMSREDGGVIPDSKWSFQNFFEIVAESIYGLAVANLGEHNAKKYYPLIGSLFLFVFSSNIIGLVPGFLPPTDNLNTTFALAIFVFLYYNWAGLRENGLGYLKHFWGPIWWLGPLMLIVEIASHIARPISLAIRLRTNIMADHIVLGVFSDLVPWLVPTIFYGMGVFVSFIQSLVFCLMTMVYINLSTAHDH